MLDLVIGARRKDLGGFEVGRVLPFMRRRMVGPFIFFDHMGPVDLPPHVPRTTDVRPPPHIGLSTVTYLFDGEIMHRDSTGAQQAIRPGAVNWMTAGSGISHSERFDGPIRQSGGRVHGLPAWVALQEAQEEMKPIFNFIMARRTSTTVLGEAGVSARLIAGRALRADQPGQDPVSPVLCPCPVASWRPDRHTERVCREGRLRGGQVRGCKAVHRGCVTRADAGLCWQLGSILTALETSTVMLLGHEPPWDRGTSGGNSCPHPTPG